MLHTHFVQAHHPTCPKRYEGVQLLLCRAEMSLLVSLCLLEGDWERGRIWGSGTKDVIGWPHCVIRPLATMSPSNQSVMARGVKGQFMIWCYHVIWVLSCLESTKRVTGKDVRGPLDRICAATAQFLCSTTCVVASTVFLFSGGSSPALSGCGGCVQDQGTGLTTHVVVPFGFEVGLMLFCYSISSFNYQEKWSVDTESGEYLVDQRASELASY